MLCIMLSTGNTTVNKRGMILALITCRLRKDFIYYRLDATEQLGLGFTPLSMEG